MVQYAMRCQRRVLGNKCAILLVLIPFARDGLRFHLILPISSPVKEGMLPLSSILLRPANFDFAFPGRCPAIYAASFKGSVRQLKNFP